mmetsp:Transcript_24706/g.71269  ORF Transcript_24706/g.71269 Transcript_24706/m.71269 type:complete len:331 (-) Transcript_24706:199-1191(-)
MLNTVLCKSCRDRREWKQIQVHFNCYFISTQRSSPLKVCEHTPFKRARLGHNVLDCLAHSLDSTQEGSRIARDRYAILLQCVLYISGPSRPSAGNLLRTANHRHYLNTRSLPFGKAFRVGHVIGSGNPIVQASGTAAPNAQLTALNGTSDRCNAATVGKQKHVLGRKIKLESFQILLHGEAAAHYLADLNARSSSSIGNPRIVIGPLDQKFNDISSLRAGRAGNGQEERTVLGSRLTNLHILAGYLVLLDEVGRYGDGHRNASAAGAGHVGTGDGGRGPLGIGSPPHKQGRLAGGEGCPRYTYQPITPNNQRGRRAWRCADFLLNDGASG